MHLVPPGRAGQRIIDEETVCLAIAGLPEPEHLRTWSERFAVLGDPTRLALLICMREAGSISVSDLAVATGLSADTVSQTLRLLRARGAVMADRDGRVMRYRLIDPVLAEMLAGVHPVSTSAGRH